jgi:phosphopantothenoylcysteine decarboxylase/phosphopantothenate--cysteine ligase
MLKHPATQRAIKGLGSWGVTVAETGLGHQACGEVGEGRLLEPHDIVAQIKEASLGKAKDKLSILITGGGPREKIDGVRFIGNISSGKTASHLAEYFSKQGHKVTYLRGEGSQLPTQKAVVKEFSDFSSLESLIKSELKGANFDLIIHAAAVSDYSVGNIKLNGKVLGHSSPKLNSDLRAVTLELTRNEKIVDKIKEWAPKATLVAFKLTHEASGKEVKEAVLKLAKHSRADLIVHNDLSEMKGKDSRLFRLFEGLHSRSVAETSSLTRLAQAVLDRRENYDSRS